MSGPLQSNRFAAWASVP